jgi:NAD(P)H dehydrogenase (quinone)
MSKTTTLFVTGASGQLGRRAVELLLARKDPTLKIIAGSRTPEKLAGLDGVEVRRVDFEQPSTLATAFAGVDRLLLVSTDALDRPGRRLAQHVAAINAAKAAGVQHVVYTSSTNPDVDSPTLVAEDHRKTEEALAASGLSYTVLRNALYTELLLMSLPPAVASGVLYAAAGNGAQNYVTRRDCAAAAAAAVASTFTGKRTLDVTGPAAHTFNELAAFAARLTNKPVRYQPLTAEQATAGLVGAGVPAPFAAVLVGFDVAVAQGRANVTSTVVHELSGHAPQRVEDFLTAHRSAFG